MIAARHERILPFANPYTLTVLGFVGMALLYIQIVQADDQTGLSFLATLALIQITPFLICVTRKHFNYIAFIMFNHFVTFSFAKYNQVHTIHHLTALFPETILAIKELTYCTLIMISSYFLCRTLFFYDFPEKQKFQLLSMTPRQMVFLSLYVITVPLSVYVLPAYFMVIHFALSAADMLLLQCSYCPKNERLSRVFQLAVPMSTMWWFLNTGFLSMAGQYGGFLFVTTCLKRKYRDFIWLALFVVVVSMVQSVKGEYRGFIREYPDSEYSDRMTYLGQLLINKYIIGEAPTHDDDDSTDETSNAESGIASGFDRIGDDSLERVLVMTPSQVPFWGGETYASIPYMFIPRALWPGKPSRHFWNKFGRLYHVLSSDDYQTSVGVGYLAEAYINFGFAGMYLCAIFMGFLAAAVERMSFHFLKGYFYFTYLAFLMPILGFGADMGTMLNSLVVLTGVLWASRNILVRLARRDDYT